LAVWQRLRNRPIYTTINFTDEFRNVSAMPRVVADWLAVRGGRGLQALSMEKQT